MSDTLQLDNLQMEWYSILITGQRLRKPANEAEQPGCYIPNVKRRWEQFRRLMKEAGMPVIYEPVKAGRYTYSTYRLERPAL